MSLTLRQKTQDALNNVGLDDYHTRINENKYLAIVGPCGQPLMTVTGIEFTRREPTIAEVAYAVELFETFLLDHGAEIQNYLTKMKQHAQSVEPEQKNDVFSIDPSHYIESKHRTTLSYQDGCMYMLITFGSDGTLRLLDADFSRKEKDFNKFFKHRPDRVLMDEAASFLERWLDYAQEEDELADLKSALSTCDI